MHLYYERQAPKTLHDDTGEFSDDDWLWQIWSLPLGNGYIGASIYGYTDTERIQITENSFANPYKRPSIVRDRTRAGLTSFANLYLQFDHKGAINYTRELSLETGVCRVAYTVDDAIYKREYFCSHPDKVLAMRISANKPGRVNFSAYIDIPYIDTWSYFEGDGLARTGWVRHEGEDTLVCESKLDFYEVICQGRWKFIPKGGRIEKHGERVSIIGADEVVMYFTCGTNYVLDSRVFTESDPKKKLACYPHPEMAVKQIVGRIEKQKYEDVLHRHINDYSSLYNRVTLQLGNGDDDSLPTDVLVSRAKAGKHSTYLHALMFQYGRYLLICSSRGHLPANLQGIWSNYRSSPWSGGYWHNINVQMNYWGAEAVNLAECFLPYVNYNQAYMPMAKAHADAFIKENFPERLSAPGENGWIIGTGAWPYTIDGPGGHSGPGTGAFTSLLFWDYYDYTRDLKFLRDVAYPVLRDMSLFFSKTLVETDGKFLVEKSASPEQCNKDGSYYQTVGCAFDQQMVYENYKRTLEAAAILGIEEELLNTIRYQLDKLDPILIGKSGQIKEFREEEYYGDIGEYKHRHISHLVALYPGTAINDSTPEYLAASRVTLNERGDNATGWATAHRLLLWARVKDASRSMDIINRFMEKYVPENLWDQHPPFQIDGNFGYMTGVTEMLLQSHGDCIELLPALPDEWSNGCFTGLVARGNFVIDCVFENKLPKTAAIFAPVGGEVKIHAKNLCGAKIMTEVGEFTAESDTVDLITSATEKIEIYFKEK